MIKVLVVAGGNPPPKELLMEEWNFADFRICADSGLDICAKYGLVPDKILGDWDSLSPVAKEFSEKHHISSDTFPEEKDDTDTALAVREGMALGGKVITILGGTGTRMDHVLGNLALGEWGKSMGVDILLKDAHNEIHFLEEEGKSFEKKNRKYLSIIPISESAVISTENLYYSLREDTLKRMESRGISNRWVSSPGTVKVHRGKVMVILSED